MTSNKIGRTLKVCLWGLLLLATAELAARYVLFPQYVAMLPDMYQRHSVFGHYNKPNLEVRRYNPMNYDVINHTNSLGLRGLEKNREKELAGIWMAGSSNTFGGYLEDSEVMSARLGDAGYPAANLSSEGHDIVKQTMLIRSLGDAGYRPRAVILNLAMFYAIKDYSAQQSALSAPLEGRMEAINKIAYKARDRLRGGIAGLWAAVPKTLQSVRARLLKSSALYGWAKVGIMGIPALRDWTLRAGLRADMNLANNFSLDLLRPIEKGGTTDGHINSTADYVAAIGDLVRDRFDVPFGVVMLPANHQIYADRFRRYVDHYGLQGQDLDPLRPPGGNEPCRCGLRGRSGARTRTARWCFPMTVT